MGSVVTAGFLNKIRKTTRQNGKSDYECSCLSVSWLFPSRLGESSLSLPFPFVRAVVLPSSVVRANQRYFVVSASC